MSQKFSRRLVHQLGEEAQLKADEKWILDTLAKIKHQRNCLQIEKLHLESLKIQSKVKSMNKLNIITSGPSTPQPQISDEIALPSTSAVNLMQNVMTTATYTEYGTPTMLLDAYCNNEVLDLAVTDVFGNNTVNTHIDTEEDDEEFEEDVYIDMNMLMNGKHTS